MIVLHLPSWFPRTEKPLDGNFIIRQIAAVAPNTTSIILHHTEEAFLEECSKQIDSNIIFYPIHTHQKISKVKLFWAYDQAVRKIIRRYGKPDLIHLHVALPMGPVAVFLSKRYHIPLVVSEHWSIYQPQNRAQLSGKQLNRLRKVYHRARYLTSVSENLHQAIVETIPQAEDVPFRQISNVVDTSIFHPATVVSQHSKKQILHVSTLDNNAKNIMGILRGVKNLSQQRNDFELNIIHDLRNEEVEQFIQDEHLGCVVHLLGKKSENEVAESIRNCDFMLQFSNYENQPCVLLESFCCGKPVLATTVGGIPEIANSINGRLIVPRNEDMLVDQLAYMLDHSHEFDPSAISANAISKYDKENIGEQFLEVYKNCTGK
ncbi:MAG: glycosyltransferase [Bacteroidales bacterium]|nr:glycosyltransferase [Bacteroidales bacterium]